MPITHAACGFPSPADDYMESRLDLAELLIKHPAATFFVRAQGESMTGAGIQPNDILVVDRSIRPGSGSVVVAVLNGEFTVKRLKKSNGRLFLASENPDMPQIEVTAESAFQVWGVVTYTLHEVK